MPLSLRRVNTKCCSVTGSSPPIASWIGAAPAGLEKGLRCRAKVRYRQPDQDCVVTALDDDRVEVRFDVRQKAVAPGQFVVFYDENRCLGGAVIHQIG